MKFVVNRIKAIIYIIIGAIKRALCCFRGRRRSQSNDDGDECLTHVIIPNRDEGSVNWNENWGDDVNGRPQTVRDHIQLYREKVGQQNVPQNNPSDEVLENLFQEMTPRYIKQKKVVIGNSSDRSQGHAPDLSRLAVSADGAGFSDLGEWMEEANSGWDEQHIDATDVLREQRRLKRENKHPNTSLGRKLKT